MSDYLLYNGRFYKNSDPLIGANNRGLRYGDGLFETLKITGDRIHCQDWHFERLFSGLALLGFECPGYFTAAYLTEQINKLCKKNAHAQARVRINIIRGNGGLYDPENHVPNHILQTWPLSTAHFQLNENGLVAGMYQAAKKAIDAFSNLKSNQFLPYTMAALHAKQQRWNDAFVLNTAGRICDSTIANVFIVKNKQIITCPLEEGCIAGIMRRFLLEQLPLHGFAVHEQPITIADLLTADEIFLSNAIKGIRWVGHFEDKVYRNQVTNEIFIKLLKS